MKKAIVCMKHFFLIKAFSNAIARKPSEKIINRGIDISGEYDIESLYLCPACGTCVGDIEGEWVNNYCHECGQKIKRSVLYDETD